MRGKMLIPIIYLINWGKPIIFKIIIKLILNN